MTRLVLASTSPARLLLLLNGGIEPIVVSPAVDEREVEYEAREAGKIATTADLVGLLAMAKAESSVMLPVAEGNLVLGCDSALEFEGEALGKPHDPEVAIERWKRMRGKSGRLYSGHYLIDNRHPENRIGVGAVTSSVVHFADLDNSEVAAYVATGEPLKVAGAFTIDGLGGAFVDRIEGDPHTVVGLSLPILRKLVREFGVDYTSLWNR